MITLLCLPECTDEDLRLLNECHVSRKSIPVDGIEPTKLYCTNRNVDAENGSRLAALRGIPKAYQAKDKVRS